MAWQQDTSYGGYSNYGNYGEGQYGVDSATLDMFDDVQAETQPVVTGSAYSNDSGHNSNTNSYYNPGNAYPTTDQRPPSQQGQAYQRGYENFVTEQHCLYVFNFFQSNSFQCLHGSK